MYSVVKTFESMAYVIMSAFNSDSNFLIVSQETLLTDIHDGVLCHLLRGSGQAVEWRLEVRVCVYLGN